MRFRRSGAEWKWSCHSYRRWRRRKGSKSAGKGPKACYSHIRKRTITLASCVEGRSNQEVVAALRLSAASRKSTPWFRAYSKNMSGPLIRANNPTLYPRLSLHELAHVYLARLGNPKRIGRGYGYPLVLFSLGSSQPPRIRVQSPTLGRLSKEMR